MMKYNVLRDFFRERFVHCSVRYVRPVYKITCMYPFVFKKEVCVRRLITIGNNC